MGSTLCREESVRVWKLAACLFPGRLCVAAVARQPGHPSTHAVHDAVVDSERQLPQSGAFGLKEAYIPTHAILLTHTLQTAASTRAFRRGSSIVRFLLLGGLPGKESCPQRLSTVRQVLSAPGLLLPYARVMRVESPIRHQHVDRLIRLSCHTHISQITTPGTHHAAGNGNGNGVYASDPHAEAIKEGGGEWETEVLFYVNGQRTAIRHAPPETTLLQYLRQAGLTGTKLGCGEVRAWGGPWAVEWSNERIGSIIDLTQPPPPLVHSRAAAAPAP